MKGVNALLFSGLTALALSGCAGPSMYKPMVQSNFAYPNSNVVPLKHAQGQASRAYVVPFQAPDFENGAQEQDAINSALQSSGGDLLIDGSYSMRSKLYPLLFVQLWTVDVTVDGTASKMEIGKRNLK